jgi:hypothetical protein
MQSAQRDEEEPRDYLQRTTMQSAQRDEEEPRDYLQRTTLTPPSTGITAPVM